ncbi:hypothetical protein B296_00014362 [Ensete ventricosum]|uniref:Uncharacterized protein n=1 Tax=Ensete ventricosum TaxID=4639 RepID=A0A426Z742_ENSVE|nr:hypothetical protein B296_00014362 [Ensete ventricosum]
MRVAATIEEAAMGGNDDWRQVAAVRAGSNGNVASRGGDWRGAMIMASNCYSCKEEVGQHWIRSLGDSSKGSGTSLETCREIAGRRPNDLPQEYQTLPDWRERLMAADSLNLGD